MKTFFKTEPRKFHPDRLGKITISDMGDIQLDTDEQITFTTKSGKRHDFACKEWGFYATPSMNSRLKSEGFKAALVANQHGQVYLMVVDIERLDEFRQYCMMESQTVLEWLDERPTHQ